MKYTIVYWYLKILSLLRLVYIKDNKLIDLLRNEKMAEIILKTETRKTFGKQNKSLRKNGIIPINMYGLGDSISLQVNEDILYKTLKEVGYTTPLKISIGGKEETYTLVRNISIHPVTDKVIHVDFLRVDLDKPIEAQVPILLMNQEEAPGTRGGAGVVNRSRWSSAQGRSPEARRQDHRGRPGQGGHRRHCRDETQPRRPPDSWKGRDKSPVAGQGGTLPRR